MNTVGEEVAGRRGRGRHDRLSLRTTNQDQKRTDLPTPPILGPTAQEDGYGNECTYHSYRLDPVLHPLAGVLDPRPDGHQTTNVAGAERGLPILWDF